MTQRKKTYIRIISLILVLTTLVLFASCRPSPVLQEIVYTDNAEIDENNKQNNNDEKNKLEDYLISAKKQNDDSDTERDYSYSGAVKGNSNSDKTADGETYDEKGESRDNASSGSSGTSSTTQNPNNSGSDEEDEILPTSDDRLLRQIVDASGSSVITIPQDVDKVTAVGDAAIYVEMLGGRGRLVATSSDFKSNRFSSTVFGSTEMNGIQSLWTGDGSSAMSDSNFKQLTKLKPEVCFVISGQTTFSNAQLTALQKRYIYVVTLPKLNTTDNIKRAVDIMAEVLGNKSSQSGKKNAVGVASSYKRWYDSLISEVRGKNRAFGGVNKVNLNYDRYSDYKQLTDNSLSDTGYYTLFISQWDTGAKYEVSGSGYYEFGATGMAIAPSGYSTNALAYNMSVGGVANSAALANDIFKLRNWYVSPLTSGNRRHIIVSANSGVWDKNSNSSLTYVDGNYLGTANFNKVIVASSSIRNGILSDELWRKCSFITDAAGSTGYGRLDSQGGILYSNAIGDYQVLVNPQGVGKWTSSSPEAPLEAVWINSSFYGDYSDVQLKNKISGFYAEFYGYTPSSTMLNAITAGE